MYARRGNTCMKKDKDFHFSIIKKSERLLNMIYGTKCVGENYRKLRFFRK